MSDYGDCVVTRVWEAGWPAECLVVERADPLVQITDELLREIVDGRAGFVEFGEGVMWFGTDGRGLGRVAYEIDDPRFVDWLRGRVEAQALTMRRIA